MVEFTMLDVVAGTLSLMVANGLAGITAAGFLTKLTPELADDVYSHIQQPRLRVLGKLDGESFNPLAFAASQALATSVYRETDTKVYYLAGMIVAPDYQGNGVTTKLLRDELHKTQSNVLMLHTQNRNMLEAAEKVSRYSYSLASGLASEVGTPSPDPISLDGRSFMIHRGRYSKNGLYGNRGKLQKQGGVIKWLPKPDAIVYAGEVI